LIGDKPHAVVPEPPANRNSAFSTRPASYILLRPSVALHIVLALAIGIAAMALHSALSAWLGALRTVPLTLAFVAGCGLASVAWARVQPAVIEIGPDSLVVWARNGVRVAQGRLTGASHWGARLIALQVQGAARRTTVLVAADALDRAAFHTLAVRARCAAGR